MKKLAVLLFLAPLTGLATGIKLNRNGPDVDVQIFDVPLPMNELRRDLSSGLSTILVGTLTTWRGEDVHSRTSFTLKVHYDLWDEVFHLQRSVGEKKSPPSTFKKSEIASHLSRYTFPSALSLDDIKRNPGLSVTFSLVVDPISKDKRKKIRKWLAQNQVSVPSSQPTALSSKTPSTEATTRGSVHRGLFGQMLDSELDDSMDSGKWNYLSPKLGLPVKDLGNEK